MITQKKVTIKGTTYEIEQFGGREGQAIAKKVLKIISPVLPILLESFQSGDFNLNIIGYAGEVFDQFDDELIDRLISRTTKGSYALDFDKDFAGNFDVLILLLIEVIRFNWGKSLVSLLEELQGSMG